MPSKNKPKRLDRQRAWRVQRRNRKQRTLVNGNSRNRPTRPKNKGIATVVIEKVMSRKNSQSKKEVEAPVEKVAKKEAVKTEKVPKAEKKATKDKE